MKKNFLTRLLQASLMCCLTVLFTACDDIFASEDNPISAYLSMSDKPVTLKVDDTYRRKAISVSSAVVEYTSSKTDVATVDNEGLVTAKAEGTTTITATATGYSSQNGKKIYQPASVSYVVTVVPATVPATSLTLNKTMEVLAKNGDALAIAAATVPIDATITWESDDAAIATVDATGKVTPVGVGIATITAKSGDVKATCKIFVGNEVDLSTKTADYPVENYDILKNTLAGSYALTIPDGYKVAFAGLTTTKTVTCSGDATIYLTDGSTNTVNGSNSKAGIQIGGEGKTLTIDAETAGDGILTAKGGSYGAGIGTDDSPSSAGGNITINGGTVNATGGQNAAGIGTGDAFSANNKCGAITINGGTVTAQGGGNASAIGTGESQDKSNTCGVITINGGTVTANGGTNAAGIGTGRAYAGSVEATVECGNIIINGGTVTANGGTNAAGIGTGATNAFPAKTASQTCGAITIGTGVTSVTATKGSSAPNSIGVGYMNNSGGTENQTCGTITIADPSKVTQN